LTDQRDQQDRCLADLMRLAQDGDRAAYMRLLRAVTPMLRTTIRQRRSFLQRQDAEDLLQNILLALHGARATYDPARPFLPWLMAIARNQIAEGARRYARRAANETIVEQVPETFSDDGTNSYDDGYGDPEALRTAIGVLPRGQRRAIEMLKLKEMSLKEAAAESGMTIPALKVAVHRAMRTLRRALGAEA
jgi:RNA polymerase sigma-70 factor (ECF subfamily)